VGVALLLQPAPIDMIPPSKVVAMAKWKKSRTAGFRRRRFICSPEAIYGTNGQRNKK
jgi:hypothetical protein